MLEFESEMKIDMKVEIKVRKVRKFFIRSESLYRVTQRDGAVAYPQSLARGWIRSASEIDVIYVSDMICDARRNGKKQRKQRS